MEDDSDSKKKSKGERRRSSELESARDEIKKFKENLLQSVASGDSIIAEREEMAVPHQSRSRSASRAREALCLPPNVLAELDENKVFELKEAFLLFDMDGDGCIDYSDLKATLISLGDRTDENVIRNMLAEQTERYYMDVIVLGVSGKSSANSNGPQIVTQNVADLTPQVVNIDSNVIILIQAPNPLDFDGFVNLLGYKTLELDSEETLVAALSRWDKDNTGYISEERIRHDLMTWGDRFTEKEADYALDDAPVVVKDGNTMIDYVRFCSQLCGLKKPNKTNM